MPRDAFLGLPHSESEDYYVKVSTIGITPTARQNNSMMIIFKLTIHKDPLRLSTKLVLLETKVDEWIQRINPATVHFTQLFADSHRLFLHAIQHSPFADHIFTTNEHE